MGSGPMGRNDTSRSFATLRMTLFVTLSAAKDLLFLVVTLSVAKGLLFAPTLQAQRTQYTINANWRYHADGLNLAEKPANSDETWERVNIPHTWNASDPFDDSPSYRRGVSWYRTRLPLEESLKGKRIFLH